MTAQLGDGASIAAETELPVISDLRSMDLAFGGQGAPIVPVGEKLLLPDHRYYLNLGGIANVSINAENNYLAFDICAANRVLNMLALKEGKDYDDGGKLARTGTINKELLEELNSLEYYRKPYPKSLANDFGTGTVYPLILGSGITIADALCTYCEHIAVQVKLGILMADKNIPHQSRLLVTGGGAFNDFLIDKINGKLAELGIEVVVPEAELINYKEALVMAFIGVLRWREEYNVLSSVTGARRGSIGGAVWNGMEG
jgi:anhydro-N-acetylmuramic acid kinase